MRNLALLLFIVLSITACREDPILTTQDKIIGEWSLLDHGCGSLFHEDLIVFTENYFYSTNFPTPAEYTINNDNIMFTTNQLHIVSVTSEALILRFITDGCTNTYTKN